MSANKLYRVRVSHYVKDGKLPDSYVAALSSVDALQVFSAKYGEFESVDVSLEDREFLERESK